LWLWLCGGLALGDQWILKLLLLGATTLLLVELTRWFVPLLTLLRKVSLGTADDTRLHLLGGHQWLLAWIISWLHF
jgi:hypothetical protein